MIQFVRIEDPVLPGSSKKDDPKLLPPTPWGRYVKILLSSSEFLFID